jgi:hypothetical protein
MLDDILEMVAVVSTVVEARREAGRSMVMGSSHKCAVFSTHRAACIRTQQHDQRSSLGRSFVSLLFAVVKATESVAAAGGKSVPSATYVRTSAG